MDNNPIEWYERGFEGLTPEEKRVKMMKIALHTIWEPDQLERVSLVGYPLEPALKGVEMFFGHPEPALKGDEMFFYSKKQRAHIQGINMFRTKEELDYRLGTGHCHCTFNEPCDVMKEFLNNIENSGRTLNDVMEEIEPVHNLKTSSILYREGEPQWFYRSCGWLREWWDQHNLPSDKWPSRAEETRRKMDEKDIIKNDKARYRLTKIKELSEEREENEFDLRSLMNETIDGIFVSDDGSYLKIHVRRGYCYHYECEGDCCSETWISDIIGVDALRGQKVLDIETMETIYEGNDGAARSRQEVDQIFGFKLKTQKGCCDIIFRNSSNGYYGGNIRRVFLGDYRDDHLAKLTWNEITDDYTGV